jgi:hypothetical protein
LYIYFPAIITIIVPVNINSIFLNLPNLRLLRKIENYPPKRGRDKMVNYFF